MSRTCTYSSINEYLYCQQFTSTLYKIRFIVWNSIIITLFINGIASPHSLMILCHVHARNPGTIDEYLYHRQFTSALLSYTSDCSTSVMALNLNWIQVLFLLCCITYSYCNCSCDSDTATHDAQTCVDYFSILENALLSNGSNIYKLRELLLNDPPELLNVTYYFQFINNESSTPVELPICSCFARNTSNLTFSLHTNETFVLRYGWTSIGVYSYIHPALLNQLQINLPLSILRTFANDDHPFLWNGYNQLPSIHLYLSIPITNHTCISYADQLDGVFKRLTSLVSVSNKNKLVVYAC